MKTIAYTEQTAKLTKYSQFLQDMSTSLIVQTGGGQTTIKGTHTCLLPVSSPKQFPGHTGASVTMSKFNEVLWTCMSNLALTSQSETIPINPLRSHPTPMGWAVSPSLGGNNTKQVLEQCPFNTTHLWGVITDTALSDYWWQNNSIDTRQFKHLIVCLWSSRCSLAVVRVDQWSELTSGDGQLWR